ncbi:Epoxide hydrolase 1 [Zostera marina]|uniref:soluble epoxide hydrolase n=1 Tax=Zostera marina TaxID=29655 RepID=A0A0K9PM18_ZOSMR|nr:Epoxide hydrolase 1 [Zostera marina]
MEGITHRTVAVNGINMHIAEKGEGTVILFIHGFPELWYSWRHQIVALADRGYHSVAPDLRGFGDTDAPQSISSYSIFHIVGDLIALITALNQDKVFVVGHDWGAIVAWHLCLFRPDKVHALVNMSVVFSRKDPSVRPVDFFQKVYGDDHYICRIQEPGVMESFFAGFDTEYILKKFLTFRKPGPFLVSEEFHQTAPSDIQLPPFLTQDDVNYFVTKFKKSGFAGPLNYYRNLNMNSEMSAPWAGEPIKVPVKFLIGDLDMSYHIPGTQDYIHKGGFKKNVPFLQDIIVIKDVGHFINQERAVEVTEHIYDFIKIFM